MMFEGKAARCGIYALWALIPIAALAIQGTASVAQTVAQTVPVVSSPPPSNLAARLSLRITQLEQEIQRLTGTNEELNHRLGQLQTRLDKMSTDMEFRLKTLEEGGTQAVPGAAGAASETIAPPLAGARQSSPPPVPVANAGKGAKVLGTLPQSAATPPQQALAESPEQQYDRAHSLIIKQRDYAAAEKALSGFIAAHPTHKLASNAYYWLGRTFFVRSDFENSVATFAEGFQKHPKSEKAPATLLNLGMSLARLGKQREACTTYAHLQRNFPKAEGAVMRRLEAERKTSKCSG